MSNPKKIGVVGNRSGMSSVGLVLASVLAAGGLSSLPSANPSAAPNQAAQRGAPTTVTRAAPGTERQAMPPPSTPSSGQLLASIGGMGGTPYSMYSRAGMDRKTWGMHPWCKKMRLKNVKAGRQPHYRPRARA